MTELAAWRVTRGNEMQIAIGDGQEFVSFTAAVDETIATADELAQGALSSLEFPPWSPSVERLEQVPTTPTWELDSMEREPWPTMPEPEP